MDMPKVSAKGQGRD